MFYKTIAAGSWQGMDDQGITTVLPFLKSGHMTQNDRRSFFHKTAASEKFLHEISREKLASGDIPVHLNAIGATEVFGCNRKGDAFSEETCRTCHPTFVKEGRVYLHHKNHDPKNSFGKVASSCYNDDMHRVELMVIANGTHEAAERNGGKVLPDEFLDKLEKNAAIPVSMGCTVQGDRCSICGNFARTRREYCDENTCLDTKTGEYFPGCKEGLMKIASDGRIQYVDNVDPHFFDISFVGVPADRTGYGFRATYLEKDKGNTKTASAMNSYSFLEVPVESGWTFRQEQETRNILQKLAEYERICEENPMESSMAYCLHANIQPEQIGQKLASLPPVSRVAAINDLACRGVLLSPENFAVAFGRTVKEGSAIRGRLPGIYNELMSVNVKEHVRDTGGFLVSMDKYAGMKTASCLIPETMLADFPKNDVQAASLVRQGMIKCACNTAASDLQDDPVLTYAYALVKAASVCRFPEESRPFGIKLAVWQNL